MNYQSNFHYNFLLLKLLHPLTRICIILVWTTSLKHQHLNLIQYLKRLLIISKTIIWKELAPLPQIHQLSQTLTKNYDPLCINNSFEAATFEPEPTFEKTINDIKANHLKIITSIDINVSSITSNKPSSSFEHLKFDLMSWILLKAPEKSPQFTNHLSSMYPNGHTQLQIIKWWVTLILALNTSQ